MFPDPEIIEHDDYSRWYLYGYHDCGKGILDPPEVIFKEFKYPIDTEAFAQVERGWQMGIADAVGDLESND